MINIVVKEPDRHTEEKFTTAVGILAKALKLNFKIDHQHDGQEQSPYKSVRDAEEKMRQRMDHLLLKVFQAIRKQWLGTLSKAEPDPFRLGKVRINPKTGRALTRGEWSKIRRSLDKVLKHVFKDQNEFMTRKAVALGKILETMPVEERASTGYDTIDKTVNLLTESQDDFLRHIVNYAELHAAEYITDLASRARKDIMQTIIDAEQGKRSARQIEEALFENFADLNKDWRRIAETEHATNVNNGFLTTKLEKQAPGEYTFLQGVAMGDACPWCVSRVDGTVVVVLSAPPEEGDKITIEGKTYTVVWPGKSNVGRARVNWWLASGAQHPHCRCSWVEYVPGFDEYNERLMEILRG